MPPPIQNGHYDSNSSALVVRCNDGYALNGDENWRCDPGGFWISVRDEKIFLTPVCLPEGK